MERNYYEGQPVVYVDTHGQRQDALITRWWAYEKVDGGLKYGPPSEEWLKSEGQPGCNLIYVSKDPAKTDPYGEQLERATSVTHKSRQSAPGNFWCFPDELT